jgi:hypothetical protein
MGILRDALFCIFYKFTLDRKQSKRLLCELKLRQKKRGR